MPAIKNFNSISPSAEFLIRLKSFTTIPFAKETAALLLKGAVAEATERSQADRNFFFRQMIHFENRYRTIDKILSGLSASNFLELSSGYSLRGLNLSLQKNCTYIDTDLPALIEEKKKIVETLTEEHSLQLKGHLELTELNALSVLDFIKTVEKFPEGNIAIINEGLLPYLNEEEKRKLCQNIHDALERKGGHWITGDIYVKNKIRETANIPEEAKKWRQMHNIEDNKFDSYDNAEQFFNDCGFEIARRELFAIEELSCLELLGDRKYELIEELKVAEPIRQTWCLKIQEK